MKLFKVWVRYYGPGDYIVVAENRERAGDSVRPFYDIDLEDDDIEVSMLSDLTEEYVYELRG